MSRRTATAVDFLAGLDLLEEELTAPPQEARADPLQAKPEELLENSLKVLRRLGSGTYAVALLVQRGDEILVLKYAREAKDGKRIEQAGVGDDQDRLVEGTHEVLAVARVDGGLASD